MDIFKLVGSVFIDTDEANKSLSKTDKKAEETGGKLVTLGKTAGRIGAAVVAGSAVAVTGMVSMAKSFASTADQIDKASIRMGISAESYQEYAYAAELAGVETTTLESAAKKLEGTDINFDQAMEDIMSFGTEEERAARAAELFGDAVAYKMSPLIEQSSESLNAAKQEANDLGLVLSNDTVSAGAALNDSFTKITESATALFTSLGASLMPIVQSMTDMVIEFMPTIREVVDELAPVLVELMEELGPPLLDIVKQMLPVILDIIKKLMPFISQVASTVLPVIVNLIDALLPILDPLLQLLDPILTLVMTFLNPLLSLINTILPPLCNLFVRITNVALKPLGSYIEFLSDVWGGLFDTISDIMSNLVGVVKGPVNSILGFINGLISGVCSGVNGIIRALNRFSINVPDWVTSLTGISTFGFNLSEVTAPQIPLLAKGGVLDSGSAIVGEDGPELITTSNKKTTVTPLNDNNNAFVDLNKKLDTLIAMLSNGFGVYLDKTAMVGSLAPGMNAELGRLSARERRFA